MLQTEVWNKRTSTLPLFLQKSSNFIKACTFTHPFMLAWQAPGHATHFQHHAIKTLIWCTGRQPSHYFWHFKLKKTTENNNYTLQPERRTRPSVLDSTGAANLFWRTLAMNSVNVSQLAPISLWVRLLSLTGSTKTVQKQEQDLWSENSLFSYVRRGQIYFLDWELDLTDLMVQTNCNSLSFGCTWAQLKIQIPDKTNQQCHFYLVTF